MVPCQPTGHESARAHVWNASYVLVLPLVSGRLVSVCRPLQLCPQSTV